MSGHTPNYCTTTWFVLLEQARHRQDYRRAAQALDELERLGVCIEFIPENKNEPGQEPAARRVGARS